MRKYFPCKMFFNIQYLLPFVLAATSGVNLLHLDYFWFSGRMTSLALAYDVQIDVYYWKTLGTQICSCTVATRRY
ncbi:hypothetical protein H5410_003336 [Solanum commersonii]|uniref:Uncharacterized protein n=1 Tax=Solanum commersonii TaxID=4109 RepID=A0A9J6B4S1_SOLCO|nr:hypothetical protein H5410_003336 [Solanum commersonii]